MAESVFKGFKMFRERDPFTLLRIIKYTIKKWFNISEWATNFLRNIFNENKETVL